MKIDIEFLNFVKKITLTALMSDDYLMDKLFFKGGNALAMIYKIDSRASLDLDFSIDKDFNDDKETKAVENKIYNQLKTAFTEKGYEVVNFEFKEKPRTPVNIIWGGYDISFQLISKAQYKAVPPLKETLGRLSKAITSETKKFTVDISKYEYVKSYKVEKFDGYHIQVYTPVMIAIEKIRSICQQTTEYKEIMRSNTSSRARDFYDIYNIIEKYEIDLSSDENIDIFKAVFEVKKVPLNLIFKINKYFDLHNSSFSSLTDTIKNEEKSLIKDFKFYFDYLMKLIKSLEDKITSIAPNTLD